MVDVALTLALLAAFAAIAFVKFAVRQDRHAADDEEARMSCLLDLLRIAAVAAGAFFFLAGTVGLLRFPGCLTRLHALTKADNLGLALVVLGLLFQVDGVLAGAEAGAGLAAGDAVRRRGVAADRPLARGERPSAPPMSGGRQPRRSRCCCWRSRVWT